MPEQPLSGPEQPHADQPGDEQIRADIARGMSQADLFANHGPRAFEVMAAIGAEAPPDPPARGGPSESDPRRSFAADTEGLEPETQAATTDDFHRLADQVRENEQHSPEVPATRLATPETDTIPAVEADHAQPVVSAYLRWHPAKDFSRVARSSEEGTGILNDRTIPRPSGNEPSLRFRLVRGHPTISYSYQDPALEGREGMRGVGVAAAGLTPDLAVGLVEIDHEGPTLGWVPGHGGPLNPSSTGEVSPTISLAGLEEHQARNQADKVYARLRDGAVRERLVSVLTAALERPSTYDDAQNVFLPGTDERDAHAIMYAALDMTSQAPEFRRALGPWTFSTNVDERAGDNADLQFTFSPLPKTGEINGGMASIRATPPESGSYVAAARTLVNTFLDEGRDHQLLKQLIRRAGDYDRSNPEDWCRRLVGQ